MLPPSSGYKNHSRNLQKQVQAELSSLRAHAGFLLGLAVDPKEGGDMFL
jgi:hypothetical protein